jgi:uncharacterized repeat protein (TIGR01451 family)
MEDHMRIITLAAALSLTSAAMAQAPQPVSLISKTQAVVTVTDAKGNKKRTLVDPTTVVPGQPLVIWLSYKNGGKAPATNFVINNPIAKGLDFTSFGEKSEWGVVSVDNGKTFGPLASMKVTAADKTSRPATAADVTHLRWVFAKPIGAGAGGTISFYAVVE